MDKTNGIGGSDGLWRYAGSTFTNIARKFIAYIYEGKKGNIRTTGEADHDGMVRAFSRSDQSLCTIKSLP